MSEKMLLVYLVLFVIFGAVSFTFLIKSAPQRRHRMFGCVTLALAMLLLLFDLFIRVSGDILHAEISYTVARSGNSLDHLMIAAAAIPNSIDTNSLLPFADAKTLPKLNAPEKYGYASRLIKTDTLVLLLLTSQRPHNRFRPDAILRIYHIPSREHFFFVADSRYPKDIPLLSERLSMDKH